MSTSLFFRTYAGNEYLLTGPPPVKVGTVIRLRQRFYKVLDMEPFYYHDIRSWAVGTTRVLDPNLVPGRDAMYFIQGIGINGMVQFRFDYTDGTPRFQLPVEQFIRQSQAHWLQPFTVKMGVMTGDTFSYQGRNLAPIAVNCELWFYGFKIKIVDAQPTEDAVNIEELKREAI